MSYKPILFNTEMVKAIKDGLKTQTRRVAFVADSLREFSCASYPDGWWYEGRVYKSFESFVRDRQTPKCKYSPGDILWVRETWRPARGIMHTYLNGEVVESGDWHEGFEYKAGGYHFPDGFKESEDEFHLSELQSYGNWHPSIHMPKEAARIFLRVKDVRVERLKDIYEKYEPGPGHPVSLEGFHYTCDFIATWENTIKPADRERYGWEANPWVWVIEFERCEKPSDFR